MYPQSLLELPKPTEHFHQKQARKIPTVRCFNFLKIGRCAIICKSPRRLGRQLPPVNAASEPGRDEALTVEVKKHKKHRSYVPSVDFLYVKILLVSRVFRIIRTSTQPNLSINRSRLTKLPNFSWINLKNFCL